MCLKNKNGQGIVEFAVIVPLFVFLLMGFMHMALVLHDYLAMGEATREMARYAAVGKNRDEIIKRVNVGTTGFYRIKNEVNDIKIETDLPQDAKLGNFVRVSITTYFDESQGVLLTKPFMPKELSTTLTMRKE